jgi:hypothetical protein
LGAKNYRRIEENSKFTSTMSDAGSWTQNCGILNKPKAIEGGPMAGSERLDALTNFRFLLEIDGIQQAAFTNGKLQRKNGSVVLLVADATEASLSCDRGNSSLCLSTSRSYSYSGSNRARIDRPSST